MAVQNFDVINAPLQGKNLIEASAGTGKTYSLAVMAVRLVVEENLALDQILLVTFTEKAVAELQIRVRSFIKKAYAYALDSKQSQIDPSLKAIVDKNKVQALENLKKAIFELDTVHIFTIHGFCQRTLTQYAFYTNESFQKELVTDLNDYLLDFSKAYIRDFFYPLTIQEIDELLTVYTDFSSPDELVLFLTQAKVAKIPTYQEYIEFYQTHDFGKNNSKVRERLAVLQSNPATKQIIDALYHLKNDNQFQKIIEQNNVLTFDDLILNLHQNISDNLVAIFKDKYKALFIDEFQDTDQLQYEIFTRLFKTQTTFYIGDPKQAIYSFRNADINTYFRAKQEVDTIYNLDKNYRSTKNLVNAVNELFDSSNTHEGLNPFYFNTNDCQIEHIPIIAHNEEVNYLRFNDEIVEKPFYVNQFSDLETIADDILSFLNYGKHHGKTIAPNQIAVLAKNNEDLAALKLLLAAKKIPAVIVSEQKIFDTEESKLVRSILKAIATRSIKDIRTFLNFSLFNFSLSELKNLEYTELISQFFNYYNRYDQYGLYDTLMTVFQNFNIEAYCKENSKQSIQYWANLNQIAEQLQHLQTQESLSLEDLITKMQLPSFAAEEIYQTRIESDEKAIQLLTIHRSKGLEFDYVFTGNINFGMRNSYPGFVKFYNPTQKVFQLELSLSNLPYYNIYFTNARQQEYRRLLYVALTRAKYGIFIYTTESKRKPWGAFFSIWANKDFNSIARNFSFINDQKEYKSNTADLVQHTPEINLNVLDKNWRKVSFSSLNYMHEYVPVVDVVQEENSPYDAFIFKTLAKGARTGDLIHAIFEYIDFNNPAQWKKVIEKSIGIYDSKKLELYQENLELFIQHVVESPISIGATTFKLQDISKDKKINELEFNLRLKGIRTPELQKLENTKLELKIQTNSELNGMLNGLIDLIFEYEGKYYILDWKSNYLGNTLEQYNQEQLQKAMTQNNYHLQYAIYSVALKKYLESKLPDFDYDKHFGGILYLFVRGMRNDRATGVFTNKISASDMAVLEKVFY